ncbi:hypothetical protein D3C72_2060280 [compost metagenome]
MHAQAFVHHRQRIAARPHLGRARRVEDGGSMFAAEVQDVVVRAHVGAGPELALHQPGQRLGRGQPPGMLDRRDRHAAIQLGGQVVGLHGRRLEGIRAAQPHLAA